MNINTFFRKVIGQIISDKNAYTKKYYPLILFNIRLTKRIKTEKNEETQVSKPLSSFSFIHFE